MHNRLTNIRPLFLAELTSSLVLINSLRADEFVTDQRNEFDGSNPNVLFYSLLNIVSHGQEFRPNLSSLNFVELLTNHNDTNHPNGSLQVLIRHDTFSGSIIGTSDVLVVSGVQPTIRTNRLRFSPAVQLVPGSNYVMQVVTFGGDFWGIGTSGSDAYPSGRMINGNSGQPEATKDLWFREGFIVPAPDAAILSIRETSVSQVEICWSSSTDRTYQLQYRSAQTTNLWTNLGTPIPGNGLTNCATDSIVGPQSFYRLITLP